MSEQHASKLGSMITGAIFSGGIGSFIFQGFSVLVLGIIGALGGWLFTEYIRPKIKPRLDKWFK